MKNTIYKNEFFPIIGLKVSNKCRMSCEFCCETNQKRPEYLIDNFYKIIDLASQSGTKRICYTGGEPLLYNHLEEVLKYAYEKGMENIIVTADGEQLQKLSVSPKYISAIRISVHGLGDYHDSITNLPGAFENINKAIPILFKNNYTLQISTVLTPDMYNNVNDIAEWCITHGIKKYYLLNLLQSGKGGSYIDKAGRVSQQEFDDLVSNLKIRYSNDELRIVAHPYERNAECILVYGNGDVFIDPYLNDETWQMKVGNIFEQSPYSIINNLAEQDAVWEDYLHRISRATVFDC